MPQILTPPFVSLSSTTQSPLFGTAIDGDLVFDGSTAILGVTPSSNTYQMNRDVMGRNVTVNNGVTVFMANYAMVVQRTLTNNGTIHNNGPDGRDGTGGTPADIIMVAGRYAAQTPSQGQNVGKATTAVPKYYITAGSGGTAGAGVPGGNGAPGTGAGGGGGAASNSASGTIGGSTSVITDNVVVSLQDLYNGYYAIGGSLNNKVNFQYGASGGAGGVFSFNPCGTSGEGGGMCWVSAAIIAGVGSIRARGGNGAGAGNGSGGSGGGGGGVVCVVYGTMSGTQTIDANGGAGGTSGGAAGGSGGSGAVIKVNLSGDGT